MKGARPFASDEETVKFLRAIRGSFATRDRAVATLGLKCGGRITSLLSLRINDVFQGGHFVDRIYFRRANRKGKREGQSVAFHPALRMALGRWLVEVRRKKGDLDGRAFLFESRKSGRPIGRKTYWEIMAAATREAGLKPGISTHTLRKTVAQKVYEASGHCLLTTGRVLGHKSIATTAAYLGNGLDGKADQAVLGL